MEQVVQELGAQLMYITIPFKPLFASRLSSGDPIAELLSQLSGVRRSASSSSSSSSQQLQQLQMQLQLERQRQRGLHQYHSLSGVSGMGNDHPAAVAAPSSSAAAAAASGLPGANGGIVVTSNSIGGVSTSHPMTMGSHLWTNVSASSKGGHPPVGASAASGGASSSSSGTFLLSQVSDEDSSDHSIDERRKRELFVEELVLASLANVNVHDS